MITGPALELPDVVTAQMTRQLAPIARIRQLIYDAVTVDALTAQLTHLV